jgi:hypothetical protein
VARIGETIHDETEQVRMAMGAALVGTIDRIKAKFGG